MKYFAAIAFVFGLALLFDALHGSSLAHHPPDLAAGEADRWSRRLLVSWLALVAGANGLAIALLREARERRAAAGR